MSGVIFKSKETIDKETMDAVNRSSAARVDAAKLVVFDENTCDMTEFNKACDHFRSACGVMGAIIGVEDFKGGYDELEALKAQIYELIETLDTKNTFKLVFAMIDLISADSSCNHEADKIGLYGAAWWYRCWDLTPPNSNSEEQTVDEQ